MRRLVLLLALAALTVPCAAGAWTWPVDGPVLRAFTYGSNPYAGGQHRGIDVGAPVGAHVAAPARGTISFTGSVPGGGRAVTIRTSDGYSVTLLQLGTISVLRGAVVEEGAVVGTVGESLDAVTHAAHVHLGVRATASEDGYIDPLSLLPPRIVVVPAPPDPPSGVVAGETVSTPPELPVEEGLAETPQAETPPAPPAAEPGSSEGAGGEPVTTGVDVAAGPAEAAAPFPATADAAPDPPLDEPTGAGTSPPAPAVPVAPLDAAATAVSSTSEWAIRSQGPPAAPALVELLPLPPGALRMQLAAVEPRVSEPVADLREAIEPALAPAIRKARLGAVALPAVQRNGRELPRATSALPSPVRGGGRRTFAFAGLLGAAVLGVAALTRRVSRKRARIMETDGELSGEDPGGRRLAIRVGTETHRPRGGLRRPVRRLRPLPATARQRRPDGEWNRRARDSRDGHGRSRGRVSA
jgi:peptidase M23-like protein